jgi:small-conductance mechanosensitive channel
VDVEHAVAGLGFGGVMIAFAIKEIVQDIFQFGIFFFDKPFRVGSTISWNGNWGHVEEVRCQLCPL